jgi:nucleotide-binding universal stress UspA family protein
MLPSLKTILYATDLGRHAPRVLRYALSIARSYGGSIVIVHAVEPLGPAARHMVELYTGQEDADLPRYAGWSIIATATRNSSVKISRGSLSITRQTFHLVRRPEG